jgi:hypothetical protein
LVEPQYKAFTRNRNHHNPIMSLNAFRSARCLAKCPLAAAIGPFAGVQQQWTRPTFHYPSATTFPVRLAPPASPLPSLFTASTAAAAAVPHSYSSHSPLLPFSAAVAAVATVACVSIAPCPIPFASELTRTVVVRAAMELELMEEEVEWMETDWYEPVPMELELIEKEFYDTSGDVVMFDTTYDTSDDELMYDTMDIAEEW